MLALKLIHVSKKGCWYNGNILLCEFIADNFMQRIMYLRGKLLTLSALDQDVCHIIADTFNSIFCTNIWIVREFRLNIFFIKMFSEIW